MQELRLPIDLETLGVLCRRYDVAELAVFGSLVRGEGTDESDIDFLVEFKPGVRIGLFRFESFAEELEAMMGRKVDLVTKRGLKPWVRPNVLREARTVYAERGVLTLLPLALGVVTRRNDGGQPILDIQAKMAADQGICGRGRAWPSSEDL